MAINKSLVKYFTVRWTGLASVLDGVDPDDEPDLEFLEGSVIFTPNIASGESLKFQNIAEPFSIIPLRRKIDVHGGTFADQNRPYVKLESPQMPDANPKDWNWHVDFDLYYKSQPVPLASFNFTGAPDETLDLTNLAPGMDPLTGVWTARGPRGYGIKSVELVGDDQWKITMDDEFNTVLPLVTLPGLTIQQNTLDAAAITVQAAEGAQFFASGAFQARDDAWTYRNEAQGFRNEAETFKGNAGTSAGAAATSAGQANTSRNEALGFRNEAEGFRTQAGTSASNAAGSATTASTKAGEANTSAGNAATSAGQAQGFRNEAQGFRNEAEGFKNTAQQAVLGIVPDNSIATGKLQDDSVALAKLKANSVDSSKIVDGSIVNADVNPSAAIAFTKLAGVPFEFVHVHSSGTRKTGLGDILVGFPATRSYVIDEVLYQFGTADAAGQSSTVQCQKNGALIAGTSLTITAANQADGTSTDAARTATASGANATFAKNDRFSVNLNPGATPGKQLMVTVRGRYLVP